MAIQMRRGLKADLDKSKLVAGEIVVKTDAREVGVTIAPSDVVDLATKEMLDDAIPSSLSDLEQDATHRTVTDSEKSTWNGKANASDIPTELADLSDDSTHRTVSDTEKATWNGKLSSVPTASANTLGGIKVGNGLVIDNNGVLSTTGGGGSGAVDSVNGKTGNVVLELADLAGDSTHRTVTDTEKATWNAASPTSISDLSDFNVDIGQNECLYQYLYYDIITGLRSRNRIDIIDDPTVTASGMGMGTYKDSSYTYNVEKYRIKIVSSAFSGSPVYADQTVCNLIYSNVQLTGATIYEPESYIVANGPYGSVRYSPCHYYCLDVTYDKCNFYYTFRKGNETVEVRVDTNLESVPSDWGLSYIVLTVLVWTKVSNI